ncbi:LOW QUALITY PROTEIN: reelin domain-containing protein 1 [Rhinophrynus dorsalis]
MFLCRSQADISSYGIWEQELDEMFPMVNDGIKFQLFLFGWACVSICLISYSAAFSHGASLTACADMRPKHIRAQPQNPRKNYITIHTNLSFYLPGDKVPVTIRSGRDFMGFLLQARTVSNDQVAGSFSFIPPGCKLLSCFEDGDTVTHSDKSLKRNLSFVWKSPDQPVGDIKFFLSVVQSYFVYWARIESAIVSGQMSNRTLTSTEVANSKNVSTSSKGSHKAIENVSTVSGLMPISTTTSTVTLHSVSSAGTEPSDILPASVTAAHKHFTTDVKSLIRMSAESVTPSFSSSMFGVGTIEPSLQTHVQSRITSPGKYNNLSLHDSMPDPVEISTTNLCDSCGKESEISTAFTQSPLSPRLTFPPDSHTRLPIPVSSTEETMQEPQNNLLSPFTVTEEEHVTTKEVSANFFHQPVDAPSDKITEVEAEITPSWVTGPIQEVVVPGKGGENNSKGMPLAMTQLGILLGCSAVLGMALAAGLRCIHAQYCHKRTEVSFSEPENNVITVTENGEMMQFRKIRENSFVLVQAEYNWIAPASGIKAQ